MIWRNIPGWDDYEASDSGSIRRVSTGCVLRARIRASHDGYAVVDLQAPSRASSRKKVTIGVHILVCAAFHGPRPSCEHEAAHGNGARTDNRSRNLRWATRAENAADKALHGTAPVGARNAASKLTDQQVIAIRLDPRNQTVIGAEYGIDRRTVGKIKNGHRWGHLFSQTRNGQAA